MKKGAGVYSLNQVSISLNWVFGVPSTWISKEWQNHGECKIL